MLTQQSKACEPCDRIQKTFGQSLPLCRVHKVEGFFTDGTSKNSDEAPMELQMNNRVTSRKSTVF